MALQRTALTAEPILLGTSPTAVLTNPASTKTFVRGLIFTNTSATDIAQVRVYLVAPSAGSVGEADDTKTVLIVDVPALQTVVWELAYCITLTQTNHSLQASASIGAAITLLLTGDRE